MFRTVVRVGPDFVYAARLFARHRVEFAVAVLSFALALGLGAAVVAVTNAWLFPRIGVAEPSSLKWMIVAQEPGRGFLGALTYSDFTALRGALPDTPLAALLPGLADVRTDAGVVRDAVPVAFVSGEFFTVGGAEAAIGRLPALEEEKAGLSTAVLSHDLWTRMFGASRDVLGSTIQVSGRAFEVVGVAAARFTGPSRLRPPAIWLPMSAWAVDRPEALQGAFPRIIVRLPTGQAEAQFRSRASDAIRDGRVSSFRGTDAVRVELEGVLSPILDARLKQTIPAVVGLVGALVAVALLNLAGFLITVASSRQREIGLRLALGATRRTMVVQMLTESLLVGFVGTGLGWFAALLLLPLLTWMIDAPLGTSMAPDGRTYLFLVAIGFLTSMGAGLVPLRFAARVEIAADVNGDSRRFRVLSGSARMRSAVVAVQVCVSVVLVMVAVLWARGAERARQVDVGFDAAHLLYVSGRTFGGNWNVDVATAYWSECLARVERVAGVDGAALVRHVFGSGYERTRVRLDSGIVYQIGLNYTSSRYFDVARIGLISGRAYTDAEVASDAPVAVVSAKVAKDLLGGVHAAIGSRLTRIDRRLANVTVVGVVSDVVGTDLSELSRPLGFIYRPLAASLAPDAFLLVHVRGEPSGLKRTLEAALPVVNVERPPRLNPVGLILREQIRLAQIPSRVAGVGAVAILLLTVVGLEGLVALSVRQRINDIAVRIALGAAPWAIARDAFGSALAPVAVGLTLGSIGGVVTIRMLSSILFGVSTADPRALSVTGLLLLLAVVVGVIRPTVWALRIDPSDLLKQQ